MSLVLIIVLLVLLFGGGGAFYGSRAGWGDHTTAADCSDSCS
jgi:hypothetical protein